MAFLRITRPKAALATALAGLAFASIGASGARAEAFGVYGEASTVASYLDSDGVHSAGNFNCLSSPSPWCGGGTRMSSTGWSTSSVNTAQGFIAGSVSAANSLPPLNRIRSSAFVDGSWWDEFSVSGGGLAANTFVDLRLTVNLVVDTFLASESSPPPYTRMQASINLGGADAPATAFTVLFGEGTSTGVGILRVRVDTPFSLWGRFVTLTGVNEDPRGQLGFASGFANYFVDVVGIEGFGANASRFDSTDGTFGLPTVITASGHDYASIPNGGGVPEPATWALMLMGFGGLGVALRLRVRRAQFAPAA